jgi:hypothetical protein
MNNKTTRVFNGWLHLSLDERREFDEALRQYRASTDYQQRNLREATEGIVTKMQTGPLGETCRCCGR